MGTAAMLVAARAGRWRSVAAVAGIGATAALTLIPCVLGPIHDANAWSMVSRPGLAWSVMSQMLWNAAGSLDPRMPWLWVASILAVTWAALSLPRAAHAAATGTEPTDLLPPPSPPPPAPSPISYLLSPFRLHPSSFILHPSSFPYAFGSVAIAFPIFLGFLKFLGMSTTPWYYLLPLALAASTLDTLGGVMSLASRWRIVRLALLAAALVLGLPFGWQLVQVRVTNADIVAAQAAQLAKPGDCILVCPWTFGVSFHYYYRGTIPWTTLPPLADNSIHRYDLMKTQIATPDAIAPVLARLGETLRSGHRVWCVGWMDAPPEGQPPHILPPAPGDPRVGWDESTYMTAWTLQVGDYLRTHAARATGAPRHLTRPVSRLEDMTLYCLQGWKDR